MTRRDVLTMVPGAKLAEANAFLVALFGDDPDSQEISLNAYADGQDPSVATHSIGVCNCSQADTATLTNYLTVTEGCGSADYPAGSGINYWAESLRLWCLKPVVPLVP